MAHACAAERTLTRREQPALALVPRDPICTLRFRDHDGPAVELPPTQHRFVIGSAAACAVVVPRDLAAAVSPCHASLERHGTGLVVRDLASRNGIFASLHASRRDTLIVEPGDTFWLANVGVTVTDGTLDVLRAHLLCHLGIDDPDELGAAGLRALTDYHWPRNLDELFTQSVRLLAYLDHGGVRRAAAALGITRQTLDDHFARIGFVPSQQS